MALQSDVKLPNDGIKLQVSNIRAFIAGDDYGVGTLCVAESNLLWRNDNGEGLCLEYPNIALHAVSSDLNTFPHECIYVMLDKNLSDNDEDDDISSNITINYCQALHPDEQMSNSDVENEVDDDVDCEENTYGNGNGHHDVETVDVEGEVDDDYYTNGDVELSVRGHQILNRIQFNYAQDADNENEDEENENQNEQFEDAD